MALSFPWEMFLNAQEQKNQNRRDMYQDIGNLGQGLGQGMFSIGQIIGEQKKKQLIDQLMQQAKNQATPIQGPGGYAPPNQGPASTAVPAGQAPPPNTQAIQGIMAKLDPEGTAKRIIEQQQMQPLNKMYPQFGGALNSENMGQLLPSVLKGNRVPNVWHPVPGMMSKAGKPLEINESTGEYREAPMEAKAGGGMGSAMAGERHTQFGINDLPSNQGPSTAGGAAFGVKVAARQGKAIIGKPGSPQQIALAAADLARAVQRSAPQMETLQGAGFSSNITTQINQLTQRITADPSGKDVPKIRKQIYDLLDDLDKTASPWITNQLDTLNENGYTVSKAERNRQMGLNIPDVPFQEGFTTPLSSGTVKSGWEIQRGQ